MCDDEPQPGPSRPRRDEKKDDENISTLKEFIALDENKDANYVVPLAWCPHLEANSIFKPDKMKHLSLESPCLVCSNKGENWLCLICHQVYCSRYVNEHMMFHGIEFSHLMCLSFCDLSVWCYGCENYVDNEALYEAKNYLYQIKFNEEMPKTNSTNLDNLAVIQMQ